MPNMSTLYVSFKDKANRNFKIILFVTVNVKFTFPSLVDFEDTKKKQQNISMTYSWEIVECCGVSFPFYVKYCLMYLRINSTCACAE